MGLGLGLSLALASAGSIGSGIYSVGKFINFTSTINELKKNTDNRESNLHDFVDAQILAIDHNDTIKAVIASFNFTEIFDTFDIDVTSTSDVNAIIDSYDFNDTVSIIVLPLIDAYDYTDVAIAISVPIIDLELDALNLSLFDVMDAKIAAVNHVALAANVIAGYDFSDIINAFDFAVIVTAITDPLIDTSLDEYNILALLAMDSKIASFDHVGSTQAVIATYDFTSIFVEYDSVNTASDVTTIINSYDFIDIFGLYQQDFESFANMYNFAPQFVAVMNAYSFPTNCTATETCLSATTSSLEGRLDTLEAVDPDANTPTIVESYGYVNEADTVAIIDAYDLSSTISTISTPLVDAEVTDIDGRIDPFESLFVRSKSIGKVGTSGTLVFTLVVPGLSDFYPGFITFGVVAVDSDGTNNAGIRVTYMIRHTTSGGYASLTGTAQTYGSPADVPVFSYGVTSGPVYTFTFTSVGTQITGHADASMYRGITSLT